MLGIILLAPAPRILRAADPGPARAAAAPQEAARAAMEACAATQRAVVFQQQALAVARQVESSGSGRDSRFLLPPLSHLALVSAFPRPPACPPIAEDKLRGLLAEAAGREGLSVDLLRAVIAQESGFRPCAVSPKGAMGLMQLMPATVSQFGVRDPFDPAQNIASGARLLKQLLTRYGGNQALALGAYNAGPALVDSTLELPRIEETLHYVQAILGHLPP